MKQNIKSNGGRVLEGEEKNAVLTEVLKQQGYNDSDIATMLSQPKNDKTYQDEEFYDDFGQTDEDVLDSVSDAYNESKITNSKQPVQSARIVKEMSFRDFKPWSGAKATYDVIMAEHKDGAMDILIDEMYPDGISDNDLNDLLWFDKEMILDQLGIQNTDGVADDYNYDDSEDIGGYPRAYKNEEPDEMAFDDWLYNHKQASEDFDMYVAEKGLPRNEESFDLWLSEHPQASEDYHSFLGNSRKPVKSNTGRVLEGEEKNAVLTEVLKQQGYNDDDIATMLSQSCKKGKKKDAKKAKPKTKKGKKAIKSDWDVGGMEDTEVETPTDDTQDEGGWRGVSGVKMIWHGETSDPELEYNGKKMNYWSVEDTLYEQAKEDGVNTDDDGAFDEYCKAHAQDVYNCFGE